MQHYSWNVLEQELANSFGKTQTNNILDFVEPTVLVAIVWLHKTSVVDDFDILYIVNIFALTLRFKYCIRVLLSFLLSFWVPL